MKQSGDLDFKIFKEVSKLSELEFLGLLDCFHISIVEDTNPIHQPKASSSEEPENVDAMTTKEIDLIDKNKNKMLDPSISPRAFPDLIEDLGVAIHKLNRKRKKNLLKFLRSTTKKRPQVGNQNFLLEGNKDE